MCGAGDHRFRKAECKRIAGAVRAAVELKMQRAEREEDKAERRRIAALRANDMDAYRSGHLCLLKSFYQSYAVIGLLLSQSTLRKNACDCHMLSVNAIHKPNVEWRFSTR